MTDLDAGVLVVGSGIAGLSFALKMAALGDVLLLTKKERAESNTNYAQGGIAAVLGGDDDPQRHVRDTLVGGAGLCHRWAVEVLVREGPDRVRELASWGAVFDVGAGGRLALGREGGTRGGGSPTPATGPDARSRPHCSRRWRPSRGSACSRTTSRWTSCSRGVPRGAARCAAGSSPSITARNG